MNISELINNLDEISKLFFADEVAKLSKYNLAIKHTLIIFTLISTILIGSIGYAVLNELDYDGSRLVSYGFSDGDVTLLWNNLTEIKDLESFNNLLILNGYSPVDNLPDVLNLSFNIIGEIDDDKEVINISRRMNLNEGYSEIRMFIEETGEVLKEPEDIFSKISDLRAQELHQSGISLHYSSITEGDGCRRELRNYILHKNPSYLTQPMEIMTVVKENGDIIHSNRLGDFKTITSTNESGEVSQYLFPDQVPAEINDEIRNCSFN